MEDQDEDYWIAVTDIVANDFLCVFELTSSLKGFSQPGLPWYRIVIFTCGQTWIHQKILVAITLVTQPRYVAMLIKLQGVKIDGFLYPNFM